jgi:diguanylate cyclase (GGDEF)-like protein
MSAALPAPVQEVPLRSPPRKAVVYVQDLALSGPRESAAFGETAADVARAAAPNVSEGVRQLAEGLQRTERMLAQRSENLRWCNAVSRRLQGAVDLPTLGREAVAGLASHTSRPRVVIALFGADGRHADLLAGNGELATQAAGSLRMHLTPGALAPLRAGDGCLVLRTPAEIAARLAPELLFGLRHAPVQALVILLLRSPARELGLLALAYPDPAPLDLLDIDTLKVLASTLSLALANAGHHADLHHRLSHDSLTGLCSRDVLHSAFPELVGEHGSAALLLLDLDRFKEVNATLGHGTGDRLLQEIGPRLRSRLGQRPQLLCRMGGDEFALLLLGKGGSDEALAVAQQLLAALREPFEVGPLRLEIGASIGVACYPEHADDSHTLLRFADVAMYEAKQSGASAVLYHSDIDHYTPQRLALMGELGPAIRGGELRLHYQPKFDLRSGRPCGLEALVRWQHGELGLLSPDRFLPLAEMSDGIHQLTAQVLALACADLARWRQQGITPAVAVNLSARNLVDEQCVLQIEALVARYRLPPGSLELELTETALMHDPERAVQLLRRIARCGVQLSIDDYGTGHSSLSYLRRLPIDALKIDRIFVNDIANSHEDQVIVRSTIQLGHSLGLKVVAEGVEDAVTLQLLREMGCDIVQGYHLSPPLPPEAVSGWARRRPNIAAPPPDV